MEEIFVTFRTDKLTTSDECSVFVEEIKQSIISEVHRCLDNPRCNYYQKTYYDVIEHIYYILRLKNDIYELCREEEFLNLAASSMANLLLQAIKMKKTEKVYIIQVGAKDNLVY